MLCQKAGWALGEDRGEVGDDSCFACGTALQWQNLLGIHLSK